MRLVDSAEDKKKGSEATSLQNGHSHHANGVVPTKLVAEGGGGDSLTRVTKGDMAEVAQL